jgi:DNA-binding response OmpR family regulator
MTSPGAGKLERILVVEDSSLQATLVCDLLDQQGYRASRAATIAEARKLTRTSPPDLFLLDRGLPDGDGSLWCRELKADPLTREIPVILLTAQDRVEERVEGLLGGADDYIPKPYHKEELLARVHGCLRTRALQQALRQKAAELEEKNRDLVATQARLVQAERLAAIGQIGLAIRHEVNNPLNTVMGYAELLLSQRDSLPPEVQKKLEAIHRSCIRIRDVIRRLEGLRGDRTVEYLPGMTMTDLRHEEADEGGREGL